jgi:hypothetical protein
MIMMNNRKAFTIVELITVVSIIALLLGLLLPSISAIRAKAREVAQKAQFNTIEMALEAFKGDPGGYGDYPPSNYNSGLGAMAYFGAQELAEALLGWDLMGFHPKTAWQPNGCSETPCINKVYDSTVANNLQERKGPYLELATANVFRFGELYNFNNDTNVLCDVYRVRKLIDKTGKAVFAGSPILYYKANTAHKTIDPTIAPPPTVFPYRFLGRIYDYSDNWPITQSKKLTADGPTGLKHPFDYQSGNEERPVFYGDKYPPSAPYLPTTTYGGTGVGYGIRDPKIGSPMRPYNPDTYILISAGPDGYYGTADDIHNF